MAGPSDEQPAVRLMSLPGQERHNTGRHPESTGRIPAIMAGVEESPDRERIEVLEPTRSAAVEDILRAHDEAHLERMRTAAADGTVAIDPDTVLSPGTYEVAMLAAGGVLDAVDHVVEAGPRQADLGPRNCFCLTRPPGHHATRDRAMGFCVFNHASIATRYAQFKHGLKRVAIVDWDVHHGNGTQDIHFDDPSVLYISLHQWPLYPGTGWIDEVGAGEGVGATVNLPLPSGCGDGQYIDAFGRFVEPVLEQFGPELLIVSAGQDGHAADHLAGQALTTKGFHSMAKRTAEFSKRHGIGLVAVHEGGYNLRTLARLDLAILAGFGGYETDLFDPESEAAAAGLDENAWESRRSELGDALRKYWSNLG